MVSVQNFDENSYTEMIRKWIFAQKRRRNGTKSRRNFLYENRPKMDFRAKTTTKWHKTTMKFLIRKWWKNGFLCKNYFVLLVFGMYENGVFYTFNSLNLPLLNCVGSAVMVQFLINQLMMSQLISVFIFIFRN